MFGRILGHISKRTVHVIGIVILTAVVGFFAATRTQVGRDQLKNQIVNTFNDAFEGELTVQRLTGNLLYTLYAEDVELRDSSGNLVAAVDSVVIEPRWRELLQRTFSVKTVTLHNPVLELNSDSDGSLNLNRALTSREQDSLTTKSDWVFKSATIEILNGKIATSNAQQSGETYPSLDAIDFLNTSFDDLNLSARVDWTDTGGQIDLLDLSGSIEEGRFPLRGEQTQVLIQGPRLTVSDFLLSFGSSSFVVSGFVNVFEQQPDENWWDIPFLVELEESNISFDELKMLVPELPVSGQANVSALIQGPLSDATISWLRLSSDQSNVELTGLAGGLPDSVVFDLSLEASSMQPEDFKNWFPLQPLDDFRMDSLNVLASSTGRLSLTEGPTFLSVTGGLDLFSDRGSVSTSYEAEGPFNDELAFDLTVTSNNMDLSYWTSNRELETDFDGAIRFVGSGTSPDSMVAEFRLDLLDLTVANTHVPAVLLEGDADRGRYSAKLLASQANGSLEIDAQGGFISDLFEYGASFQASSFDFGPLGLGDSLQTSLNFDGNLFGSGLSEEEVSGELYMSFDESEIRMGSRSGNIRAHDHRLTLRKLRTVGPRITLRGDVMDLDVAGNVHLSGLTKLVKAWSNELGGAISRQKEKKLYSTSDDDVARDDLLQSVLWADANQTIESAFEGKSASVRSDILVHDLGIVSGFLPSLPQFGASGLASVALDIGDDRFSIEATFSGDSLQAGTSKLRNATVESSFSAGRSPSIESSTRFLFSVRSDSIDALGQSFSNGTADFTFENREGDLLITSGSGGRIDSVRVASHISLFEDENSLIFEDIFIQGKRTYWKNVGTPIISIYSDAIVVQDGVISERGTIGAGGQQFIASGTYSSQAQDTLYVQADNIVLHEVADVVFTSPHLDGLLNAKVEITGGENQPIVTGVLGVEHLALDNQILGNLDLASSFIPGSPNLNVNLDLVTAPETDIITEYDGDLDIQRVDSELSMSGIVRLPGTPRAGIPDEGILALDVAIDSTDFFFLKYIFKDVENVEGFLTGGGQISGSLANPQFDIDLELKEAHFDIPIFDLSYDLTGDLRIDEEGIQVDRASLVDKTQGTATGRGTIFFNDYRFFSLGLNFELNEFQIMDLSFSDDLPFYGHLWGTGDLSLDGELDNAELRSSNAQVTPNSELFIPVVETASNTDDAYIVFADSAGHIPDFKQLATRSFLLGRRPDAERRFLDALDMELSITAPLGSTIHLVIDPLLGDVINASSSGNVQIQRREGEFRVFGELDVSGGDYLFTAGEVFVRRFIIEQGGSMAWNGDPVNAILNIPAVYRTRASLSGLPGYEENSLGLVPLIVSLQIGGTVESPEVELGLAIDRSRQNVLGDYQALESQLNSPERATEYATSVLLTNTFRLTTDSFGSNSGSQLAFNSVSQLVSSQVNRFINEALPNVDFSFGLQGENAQDLDVTYGVALRLLDERLIIRGEGVYQGSRASTDNVSTANDGLQGEFLVEVRLSPRVSVEVFFRREGDILESATLTNTTGAGLSYQTEFSTWKNFWNKLFGWLKKDKPSDDTLVVSEFTLLNDRSNQ